MTDTFVMSVVNGLPSGQVINSPKNSKHRGRSRGCFGGLGRARNTRAIRMMRRIQAGK